MKKSAVYAAVAAAKTETHDALQTVVDALNKGQRQKLAKNAEVKAVLERYGVTIEAEA